MTTELGDLYQQVIIDHQRSPRNFRPMPQADRTAQGDNPLCGDRVTVYVKLEGRVVTDVSFQGVGCAICTSSASLMTQHIKGKSLDQIETLFQSFRKLVTGTGNAAGNFDALGKLRVFSGVREFPIRVKCATLPWHTLHAAIEGRAETVTTE